MPADVPLLTGRVLGVYVGQPRSVTWLGRDLTTSIDKHPVAGPVRVLGDHLDGDRQADLAQHGGRDKAVYAYAEEDAAWWAAELGRQPEAPQFGENLRTEGLDLHACVVGETWRVGSALLQVSEPRTPCWKIGYRMGDAGFPRRFAAARRTGALLRVLEQGALQAGDTVEVLHRPDHGVTVGTVNDVYYGRDRDVAPILRAPELAGHWHAWARHRTVWHLHDERALGIQLPAGPDA